MKLLFPICTATLLALTAAAPTDTVPPGQLRWTTCYDCDRIYDECMNRNALRPSWKWLDCHNITCTAYASQCRECRVCTWSNGSAEEEAAKVFVEPTKEDWDSLYKALEDSKST
ncbi:hypothetical protein CC78DRAFT_549330 [Lojkania enalia]|uniref:Uncharacterized protein n=1 Tax=Lojkania enalia TaxID=147567 RepID=A0A9P4MXF9_9PLEO|nr:hypothetical protein CC78DRAFT_549330 [Didymosphaeria enalia]